MDYFFRNSKIFLILTFFLLGIFLFSGSVSADTNGLLFLVSERDVTPITAGSWQTVDVSAYVPLGSTGAILRMVNTDSVDRTVQVRKKDPSSTDNFTTYPNNHPSPNMHFGAMVALNANREFEAFIGSTLVKIYLVGYTDDAVVLFTNYQLLVGPPATGTAWADFDLSPYIPVDATGIMAFIYDEVGGTSAFGGIRKNGSTDTFPYTEVSYGQNVYQVSGVDANRMIEIQRSSRGAVYLAGYFKAPVSFETNGADYSLITTASWQTITVSSAPANSSGALWMLRSDNYSYYGGVKKYGSSDESYGLFKAKGARFFATALDTSKRAQGKIDNTDLNHYVMGYVGPASPGGDTTPPARSNGLPTGTLAAGTTQTTISLVTDEPAACRYSTTAGTAYDSMTNNLSTTDGTSHSAVVTGLTNGNTYYYYIRCRDTSNNTNTDDWLISFAVALVVPPPTANLTLDANFHTISVIAPFSTTPSSVVVQYKRASEGTWRSYDNRLVFVDTRTSTERGANWAQNTARFKIFGLNPNTIYDVRVTFDGNAVLTGQVTTLDTTPPNPSLRTVYVATNGNDSNNGLTPSTPKLTIQAAFNMAQAGDRIWIKPGTYILTSRAILSANGTASNWIRVTKWEGETDDIIIEGNGAITNPLYIGGSYIRMDNLTIRKAVQMVVDISSYSAGQIQWVWIDNNVITDWNINNVGVGNNYSGISINESKPYGPLRMIIMDNYFKRRDTIAGSQSGPGYGIALKQTTSVTGGGHIIKGNTVVGGRDGISCEGETEIRGCWYQNTDIYENDVSFVDDNAIQLDGASLNSAVWDNKLHTVFNAVSLDPISIGPAYAFRNRSWDVRDMGGPYGAGRLGYKVGNNSSGMWYMIHESNYLANDGTGVYGDSVQQQNSGLANFMILNSALQSNQYVIDTTSKVGTGGIQVTNYNVLYTTDATKFVQWWGAPGRYTTLAQYQAATDNESNGQTSNLAINDWTDAANGDFATKTGSVLRNAGVVLAGINYNVEDATWNYKGSAPDIGAVEYDSGAPVDTAPPVRSNAQPSGILVPGTLQVALNLQTNESATCRYSNAANTSYPSMPNTFSTTGGTSHSTLVAGLTNGNTYNYYVRCQDSVGNANNNDYTISFSVTVLGDISSQTAGQRDGKVNIYDVSRMLSKWGSILPADLAEADINPGPGNISQGRIDLYDANLMMKNWRP